MKKEKNKTNERNTQRKQISSNMKMLQNLEVEVQNLLDPTPFPSSFMVFYCSLHQNALKQDIICRSIKISSYHITAVILLL